jgi:glycosyltransferase involved in cell wall biosynthesis
MPQKYKILVSAYACSPNKGSEPGMGWNFVTGLSKFHELHVIVEKRKWQQPINEYLNLHPTLKQNLTFHFINKKRNKWLRKLWPPSYYWFYEKWQKKAYNLALELDEEENFDIIHQLNMVGYREPGYLWNIEKPFVWGPIGGLENSPWRFLPSLGIKGFMFYTGRNLMNLWQRNFSKRPKQAARRSNTSLIAATPDNQRQILNLWHSKAEVICEVGQEKDIVKIVPIVRTFDNEPLKIIWSGLHTPRKNLPLLFNALKKVTIPFELHILGNGEMTNTWKKIAQKKDLSNNCIWYGWVDRQKAIDIMSSGHVFCITSISDLTSTVTLEALSYGLPTICLDHCGFSHVIDHSCGVKIPVTTIKDATSGFKNAIEKLYFDEGLRQNLSTGAIVRAQDFSWEGKIEQLNTIYHNLLKES